MWLAFQISATLPCVLMAAVCVANVCRARRERVVAARAPAPDETPPISVCVPARNEAHNIARCIESLARQDYPDYEVLVLDDCSDDATGAVARVAAQTHPHVCVLDGEPLAPGWIGKAHACRQLAAHARGRWVLFTDADTVWRPHALRTALSVARSTGADLLSAVPGLRAVGFWERLSVPILATSALGWMPWAAIAQPRLPQYAAASGAFLFFRREAYDAIGGHEAVRDKIVEDIELARTVKRRGRRLVLTGGADLVATRMYRSRREAWEGFTKNLYSAFSGAQIVPALVLLLLCFVWPWVSMIFGGWMGEGALERWGLPTLQLAAVGFARAMADRWFGTGRGAGRFLNLVLTPLGGLFFSAAAVCSAGRAWRRRATPWRGRHYDLWRRGA